MKYDPKHDPLFADLGWDGERQELTPRQRQATILRGKGLNRTDIAKELGITTDAVKKLMKQARDKSVFCFQCERCLNEVETETLEGECPHCHSQYKLEWQAEYKGKQAKLLRPLD